MVNIAITNTKSHAAFRLPYLNLTLTQSKGQGQGHAHFNCTYLANVRTTRRRAVSRSPSKTTSSAGSKRAASSIGCDVINSTSDRPFGSSSTTSSKFTVRERGRPAASFAAASTSDAVTFSRRQLSLEDRRHRSTSETRSDTSSSVTNEYSFFVCTNDWTWTKENVIVSPKAPNFNDSRGNVTSAHGGSRDEDFAVLSICDHVIMLTGSFEWWAALLANGTTIFYKNWQRPGSLLSRDASYEDVFSPGWIPIL